MSLPDALVWMLSEHVRTVGVRPDGWLFVGTGDGPPHNDQVSYWWRKTLTASGLSGVKLHDLRHFYASGLIAHGCDVVTVQRAAGALVGDDDVGHLFPSVAHCGGPHPQSI